MQTAVNLKIALFGGAGIGLLFGVVMGTSVTPTVTMLLGALTTILAAILGLNDRHFNDAKAVRIGAFGVACVLGAYLGIYVRSHNLLAPSLKDLKGQYMAVGYTEQQALQLLTLKEFGLNLSQVSPESYPQKTDSEPLQGNEIPLVHDAQVARMNNQHSSLLFSAAVEVSGCDELAYTDETLALDEVLNNFELTGGVWAQLAENVSSVYTTNEQKGVLLATRDALCMSRDSIEHCPDGVTWSQLSSLSSAQTKLGPNWQPIFDSISEAKITDEQKFSILKLTHHTLCTAL
ncbi:hypothetical protein [Pseudoalteromonas luteoviolacea]|uniref:Uncharacterized protein n=1 Tax=Pseudoalteromonas luteoviolacea S4060-1 TaxID=1365257 RepID=A0A167IN05_9GAMM|nr:hypothetical protein [Pseudoalteromonas luteoviolacea]KZN59734.1 hypothetical protein N478_08425 [Pseudoalteromonas luteoviolacea S4060-1]